MSDPDPSASYPRSKGRVRPRPRASLDDRVRQPLRAAVLKEVERAGLLAGEKTEHVSFRAPPALVQAAKQTTGVTSTSELGILALAMLARPDPVASFFKRTHGCLGPDHDLDY